MRSLETIDNGTVWVNPAHVTMIFDRRGPEGVKTKVVSLLVD